MQQQCMQQAASHVPLSLFFSVCPLSISPRRCLFLWLLNCLRESSERQRSEEIIMRCALSYFDLGHVSHNSSGPLSPSSLPCFPALPPPPLAIIFAIVEFSSVVCLSCSWSHESFGRTISVELIGIGSTSGYPTITLPYHVFFFVFFCIQETTSTTLPTNPLSLSLRFLFVSLPSSSFVSFIHRVLGLFIVFLPLHATLFSNCLLHSCHTGSACSALSILSELITFSPFYLEPGVFFALYNYEFVVMFACMNSYISGTVWVRAFKFADSMSYYCKITYQYRHAF